MFLSRSEQQDVVPYQLVHSNTNHVLGDHDGAASSHQLSRPIEGLYDTGQLGIGLGLDDAPGDGVDLACWYMAD